MSGLGQNMQNGIAFVGCDSCYFANGVDFGYTVGVIYEEQLSANEKSIFNYLNFGGLLHFSNRDIISTFREIESVYFTEYEITLPLMFRHTKRSSISTVGLMPFIRWTPQKYFFMKVGFDFSYIYSNNIKHEKELLDRRKTLPNGEIINVYIPVANPNRRTYSHTVQDSEVRDLNNLQISFVPSIGANIYWTEKFLMSPGFSYHKSLRSISEFGENFRIDAWRINLEFKYNLTTSNKIYTRR